jgi:transposase
LPRTNPTYPPEFRREAVRLVRTSNKEHPIPGIAREIGVCDGTLRNWVNQDEIDSGERAGLTTEEKEELRKLRREVKTLRQEKEILRKAAVGSTGRCNTVGFGCCLDRRCASGETGSSWRVVGGG